MFRHTIMRTRSTLVKACQPTNCLACMCAIGVRSKSLKWQPFPIIMPPVMPASRPINKNLLLFAMTRDSVDWVFAFASNAAMCYCVCPYLLQVILPARALQPLLTILYHRTMCWNPSFLPMDNICSTFQPPKCPTIGHVPNCASWIGTAMAVAESWWIL